MNLYNKRQANFLKENYSNLIGTFGKQGPKITHIWFLVKDVDFQKIMKQYQFNKKTTQDIAESYGKGQNLYVIFLFGEMLKVSSILGFEGISEHLNPEDLETLQSFQEEE